MQKRVMHHRRLGSSETYWHRSDCDNDLSIQWCRLIRGRMFI